MREWEEMAMKDKKNEARERASWRERVSRALDVPPDLLPGGSLMEIRGREAMTVRGSGKILVYTPEEVCVELGRGVLSVKGRRLVCISYYLGALGIEGQIDEVVFGDALVCSERGGESL